MHIMEDLSVILPHSIDKHKCNKNCHVHAHTADIVLMVSARTSQVQAQYSVLVPITRYWYLCIPKSNTKKKTQDSTAGASPDTDTDSMGGMLRPGIGTDTRQWYQCIPNYYCCCEAAPAGDTHKKTCAVLWHDWLPSSLLPTD